MDLGTFPYSASAFFFGAAFLAAGLAGAFGATCLGAASLFAY